MKGVHMAPGSRVERLSSSIDRDLGFAPVTTLIVRFHQGKIGAQEYHEANFDGALWNTG
jgi:hypothetical protein